MPYITMGKQNQKLLLRDFVISYIVDFSKKYINE